MQRAARPYILDKWLLDRQTNLVVGTVTIPSQVSMGVTQ